MIIFMSQLLYQRDEPLYSAEKRLRSSTIVDSVVKKEFSASGRS
jgi:hypothetical protein